MTSVTDTIRERLTDIDGRIERLRAEIAKAESDKRDLETTLRVLGDVGVADTPAPQPAPKSKRPASEKKKLMLDILGVGERQGKAPAQVYSELVASGIDDINIGTVRTTLWRAADGGELGSGNGAYWKHEAEESLYGETSAPSSSAGMTTGGTQQNVRWREIPASHDAPSSRSGEVGHEVG